MAEGDLSNDPISAAEIAGAPEKPARAPQPRDEHGHYASKDPGKAGKPGKGKAGKGRTSEELSLDQLEAMLTDQLRHTAPLVMLPTASLVWEDRSAEAVQNLITLARRFPSMRTGLETGVVIFAGLGLVNFTSAVAFAGACDLGFADPDGIAAQSMGITDAFYRAHPEEERERGDTADDHGSEPDEGSSSNGSGRLAVPSILGDVRRDAP